MTKDHLMVQITNHYSHMTKAEKKVADFILSNPQEALRITITDLARMCSVGETSVFRFCRTLGLKGYQDFKFSLALSIQSPNESTKGSMQPQTPAKGVVDSIHNVFQTYQDSLRQVHDSLNTDAISKTVDFILSARTVNLFGFGGSGTSAIEFRNKFMKIMPNINFNTDSHMQLTQAALLGNEDLAIIFCNSGITKDCIEIAKTCHASGVRTVFITKFAKTPASAYSSILLLCGANEGPMEGGSIETKTSQLFLIDVLYAEAYRRLGDAAIEHKQRTSKIIVEKMM
jgi:DNA-binding MurR/RpiR family transcriptional regulator